jgi:hypothetical protein
MNTKIKTRSKLSIEHKKRIGAALKGVRKGIKLSDAHKRKLSEGRAKYFLNGGNSWNKGKKYSLEYRKKLSDAHKGQKSWCKGLTKECNASLARASGKKKGRKFSAEQIKKMSQSLKGRKATSGCFVAGSDKLKEIIKLAIKKNKTLTREKNHRWKGGPNKVIVAIRQCPQNKDWKLMVFGRDNYTCQKCGVRGVYLHAHHKIKLCDIVKNNNIITFEEALACDIIWDLDNGITLCRDCHYKLHWSV